MLVNLVRSVMVCLLWVQINLQQRSSVCKETMLDSNAREAKERLDQKLRSQRESVVKRWVADFAVLSVRFFSQSHCP